MDVPWSTNVSMQKALVQSGHIVVPFNYRTIAASHDAENHGGVFDHLLDKSASFFRSDRVPIHARWYYHRNGRGEMNRQLLQTVQSGRFDLALLCKTDTVNYDLLLEIQKYCPTWYFFMDPMDQALRMNAAMYAKNATWASATFSDVVRHFKEKGAQAYWITQGLDVDVFKPCVRTKVQDVAFVGTRTAKRLRCVQEIRRSGIDIACFGEGWENPPAYQEQLAEIYQSSRLVLNFCREGRGFSIRVFQVMGTDSFLLSEHCPDLERFFCAGEHLDWFKNESEAVAKIHRYLADEPLCQQIARRGGDLVRDRFSWGRIMERIMGIAQSAGEIDDHV